MKLTKKYLNQLISEVARDYVWGVKSPNRVANQYGIEKEIDMKLTKKHLKNIIKEELDNLYEAEGAGIPPAEAKADLVQLSREITAGPINDKERQTIINLLSTLMKMALAGELNQQAILTYLEKAVDIIQTKIKEPAGPAGGAAATTPSAAKVS